MLIVPGVDISRLLPPIRKKLNILESIFAVMGCEPVITSTYEGRHMAGSLHYANLSIDFRIPACSKRDIDDKLHISLGKDYDIVWEKDHIHIEYDPK